MNANLSLSALLALSVVAGCTTSLPPSPGDGFSAGKDTTLDVHVDEVVDVILTSSDAESVDGGTTLDAGDGSVLDGPDAITCTSTCDDSNACTVDTLVAPCGPCAHAWDTSTPACLAICEPGWIADICPSTNDLCCYPDVPVWGAEPEAGFPLTVTGDATVQQAITGLTWYRMGHAGPVPPPMNWYQAKAWCDNLDTGGFTDWRLPTPTELLSLTPYADNHAVRFDPVVFDLPQYADLKDPACDGCFCFEVIKFSQKYMGFDAWTLGSGPVPNWETYEDTAFVVAPNLGKANWDLKTKGVLQARPWCVRGGSWAKKSGPRFATGPTPGFVSDQWTGLAWRAELLGTDAVPSAAAACGAVTADGGGWRVPTARELAGLAIRDAQAKTTIDIQYFPAEAAATALDGPRLSSTYCHDWSKESYCVPFVWGGGQGLPWSCNSHPGVRCVRTAL